MKVTRTFKYGAHDVTIETGVVARQADGAVMVNMADTVVLVTAVGEKKDVADRDFFPLTVNYSREDLRRGTHPGRVLQARRPAERKRDAHLTPDRPADPAAVPGRLHARGPGDRDRAVDEHRNRLRHPGDARRVGRAGAVGLAVPRSDRRRASRLHERPVPAEPDRDASSRSRSSTSSSPARRTPC